MSGVDVLQISIISFFLLQLLWAFESNLFPALVPERPTFGDIHGIQAAQQVSDVQVVPFLPTQPVVAGEEEAQVGPDHVGHHHPV